MRDHESPEKPVVFLTLRDCGLGMRAQILHGFAPVSEDCADMPDPLEEEKHLPMG